MNFKTVDFLPAALLISGALHMGAWGLSRFMPSPAQYPVVAAPNAIDVVLVEDDIQPPVEEEPLAVEEPLQREKAEVEESQESLGALSEAVALEFANPAPAYPALARRRGWEGVVTVEVRVEADGTPSSVTLAQTSGHSLLDEAALEAIRHWRFKPAQRGSLTFSSTIRIPVRFRLLEHF